MSEVVAVTETGTEHEEAVTTAASAALFELRVMEEMAESLAAKGCLVILPGGANVECGVLSRNAWLRRSGARFRRGCARSLGL